MLHARSHAVTCPPTSWDAARGARVVLKATFRTSPALNVAFTTPGRTQIDERSRVVPPNLVHSATDDGAGAAASAAWTRSPIAAHSDFAMSSPLGIASVRAVAAPRACPNALSTDDVSTAVRGDGSFPESSSCSPDVPRTTNSRMPPSSSAAPTRWLPASRLVGDMASVAGPSAVTTPAVDIRQIHVLVPEHKTGPLRGVRSRGAHDAPARLGDPGRHCRSHRWCAPVTDAARRIRSARRDHGARCPMLCNERLCTVGALSRGSRDRVADGAQPSRAPFWPTLPTACDPQRNEQRSSCGRVPGCPTRGGTPRSGTRKVKFLGYGDCWLDEVAMLWEIESTEWHLSPSCPRVHRAAGRQFHRRRRHLRRIRSRGCSTPIGVRCSATLRAAYDQACARPRPPLRAMRRRQ